MKLEKSVTIILTYRQSPGETDLKSMLSSVLSLLGISTDPNNPSKYVTLKAFSSEAYNFVELIHGAMATIAMALFGILLVKKVIEKSYATKKINYTDIVKHIFLFVVIKVIIDRSLWLVNALYAFVVKLIGIIGAIDLSMLPGASIGEVYEMFAYNFWNDVDIWNFMQKIATSGTQMSLYFLGLILMLVYYVLFALIILYACVVIIKRYIHILIYSIIMPLTICFFLDEKLNVVGKNHLKQLFVHLFSGVTLTISIYFMIIIGSVFSSIEILQNVGSDEFQIIIKWGFAIAAPVVMFMTIKASKNITEKIVGG